MEAAQWAVVVATFLAVLVALFKEDIVRWWRCPRLVARIRLEPPDCHRTELVLHDRATGQVLARGNCYYFRLWVENRGRERADRVQVFAAKLLRKHADGQFKEEGSFLPMNLVWSHPQDLVRREIFAEGISPGMGKHCDLGHIEDPALRASTGNTLPGVSANQTVFVLDLEFASRTLSHLLAPAAYRLELRLGAANAEPVAKKLEITLTGNWFQDQDRMFSDGIGIVQKD